MRLDKLLANTGHGSRKDVKTMLKKKQVTVNDSVVKDGSIHIEQNVDTIKVQDRVVFYQKYIYLMMNKPQGVISATVDDREKTVIDLLKSELHHFKAFPVGRLDKDTEGLLLITNDGELTHQLVSPKKNIEKVYFAKINGFVTDEDIDQFAEGITLGDGYKAKPAKLTILKSDTVSEIEVTITEGKYHQVKRMFESVNKKVMYLKRLSMGEIFLDDTIKTGTYRELTEQELDYCLSLKK
ncbi:16S rRNA pseudouridine516 synthase [Virgibacillus natechei]|uniref:Pseudouridine synthase n=1 Tax=Virgibacillus natechei TaxID=1216297 RepID=A0ABS4IDC3_9BACI|nr:pseudouridine synthase [Virgibacillus natechei]MBP1968939.1 16S rRNA pseudouridine516 synthase [Virgibacillus natechei]UZD14928.1 rRNA pseudouridine synthase [Virgibacillus natechei]